MLVEYFNFRLLIQSSATERLICARGGSDNNDLFELSQETLLLGTFTGDHLSHTNVDSVILGELCQNS